MTSKYDWKSDEAKDDEPTKKSGKRRKQMARKGLHTDIDKDDSEDSDEIWDGWTEDELGEDKKLQGGKPDENCCKMLKMMEKQAGIRK
ncbi:hypothetical protein Tco_0174140 [Tanacetum coccineum]